MPTVKIQHADPSSSHVIAFDILAADDMETVRDTFVLESGHFKLIELGGGMMLREVTAGQLAERERQAKEDRELAEEVENERLADEKRQRADQEQAEREQRKDEVRAQMEKEPGDNVSEERHDLPAEGMAPKLTPEDHNLDPVLPPNSEERDTREHELDAAGIRRDTRV